MAAGANSRCRSDGVPKTILYANNSLHFARTRPPIAPVRRPQVTLVNRPDDAPCHTTTTTSTPREALSLICPRNVFLRCRAKWKIITLSAASQFMYLPSNPPSATNVKGIVQDESRLRKLDNATCARELGFVPPGDATVARRITPAHAQHTRAQLVISRLLSAGSCWSVATQTVASSPVGCVCVSVCVSSLALSLARSQFSIPPDPLVVVSRRKWPL